jgi:hypothetical protein
MEMFRRRAAPSSGLTTEAAVGGDVEVPGVLEAVTSATFEIGGEPVCITGPDAGRFSDIVHETHPGAAVAHRELFRPLRLSLGLRHDLLREHLAGRENREPACGQG